MRNRPIIICVKCQNERPLHAFGMCRACYCHDYDRIHLNRPHPRSIKICLTCGNYCPTQGHGLCKICYNKRYHKDHPKDPKAVRKAVKKYRKCHPKQVRAWMMVKIRVRYGTISKPKLCPKCGIEAVLHAHHNDYGKPLEIEWLCRDCHKNHHKTRVFIDRDGNQK